jgi:hypothetical protein
MCPTVCAWTLWVVLLPVMGPSPELQGVLGIVVVVDDNVVTAIVNDDVGVAVVLLWTIRMLSFLTSVLALGRVPTCCVFLIPQGRRLALNASSQQVKTGALLGVFGNLGHVASFYGLCLVPHHRFIV